jgi:hypothetical protein
VKLYPFPPRDRTNFDAAPSFGAVEGQHYATPRGKGQVIEREVS